jgi:light-regulated signal transduction histidine kinase (bacteriophytochrome)
MVIFNNPLKKIIAFFFIIEPIHIPGAIQHHGALIALSLPSMKIEYLSDNTPALIGLPHIQPDHLFELKSFKKLLSDYQRDRLYKHVDALRGKNHS